MPRDQFMDGQSHVSTSMRAILCDWLVDVTEEYKLNAQSLYLAVNYLDRFLSVMNVPRPKLQLVGECMYVHVYVVVIYACGRDGPSELMSIEQGSYSSLSLSLSLPLSLSFCLGLACLFVSTKIEEVYPPTLNEFAYIADNTYSEEQVHRHAVMF